MNDLGVRRLGLVAFLVANLVPLPAGADWEEGRQAFLAGRLEEAVAHFRAVTHAHPDFAAAFFMLGKTQQRQGLRSEALTSLQRAVELDPTPVHALALAQVQLEAGRAADSLESLRPHRLQELPEDLKQAYAAQLAAAALEAPDTGGRRYLEAVVGQAPKEKSLWVALGKVRERDGQLADALAAYRQAVELDPGDQVLVRKAVQLAWDLAAAEPEAEQRRARFREAAELAVKGGGREPSPAQALLAGEALLLAGEPGAARGWIEPVAGKDGGAAPWLLLARCSLDQEQGRPALKELQQALARAPDADLLRRIHRAQGTAHHLLGEFERAADAYRRAGDPVRAAEMDSYREIAASNDEIERRRRECREKQARIAEVRQEKKDLFSSADWQRLEREFSAALAECRPYLGED